MLRFKRPWEGIPIMAIFFTIFSYASTPFLLAPNIFPINLFTYLLWFTTTLMAICMWIAYGMEKAAMIALDDMVEREQLR